MAVREGLLALLATEPKHGYQLKLDFEEATGGAWPLNIGQVYTTLQRLERDGCVAVDEADPDRKTYEITDVGRAELASWLDTPTHQAMLSRDELAIKVLVARGVPMAATGRVISRQRTATMEVLQEYTALKAGTPPEEVATLMHLDRLILQAEAELRWLDRAEERLAAASPDLITLTTEPVIEGGRV